MNTQEFKAIMQMVRMIKDDCPDGITDEMAYDMALGILSDNPKLEAYIQSNFGATDAVGWLMQEI